MDTAIISERISATGVASPR
jgi:DNA repair exonuclease SbcCD ATPase subunit